MSVQAKKIVLQLCDLSFATPDGKLLAEAIHLQLAYGEKLIITGANGAGKSTLLRVILGHSPPRKGSVSLDVPRRSIFYLPQLHNTYFHLPMTLRDVVYLDLPRRLRSPAHAESILAKIEAIGLLSSVALDLAWNDASGGERQKALLTRALLSDAHVLILDEPYNHLDQMAKSILAEGLDNFLEGADKAVLMVSHEPELPMQMTKNPSLEKRLELGGRPLC